MTIVEGQIESLKSIRRILSQNGITRFNSIGDINNFKKNYDSEKLDILKEEEHELDLEIRDIRSELISAQQNYDDSNNSETNKINNQIRNLKKRIELLKSKVSDNIFSKIFHLLLLIKYRSKLTKLEKNYQKIIQRKTKVAEIEVIRINRIFEEQKTNREKVISERIFPRVKELDSIKEVVEGLNSLIAGAIGENLVVKELKYLSDEFVLFNDFSIIFRPPIYNRKEKDRIFSIQIDHLLVTNSGVFILETKNWSKKSINSFDLRSPVKQIMRTSYALFVIFNGDFGSNKKLLNKHHWGNKQIPIRNIVVMVNEKPKELFQYVKVKTLNELNGYITHFQTVFDDEEVKRISDYLRTLKSQ